MEEKVKNTKRTNGGLLFIFCILKYSPNIVIHIFLKLWQLLITATFE